MRIAPRKRGRSRRAVERVLMVVSCTDILASFEKGALLCVKYFSFGNTLSNSDYFSFKTQVPRTPTRPFRNLISRNFTIYH